MKVLLLLLQFELFVTNKNLCKTVSGLPQSHGTNFTFMIGEASSSLKFI